MRKVLVLHGPNLNLLGTREREIYGEMTLGEIDAELVREGKRLDVEVRTFQSNHEGALIDALHEAQAWADAVIFNPAGFTHTSVALRDAVAGIRVPVVEVHLSNIFAREDFRERSLTGAVCRGVITGFGWQSYLIALRSLDDWFGATGGEDQTPCARVASTWSPDTRVVLDPSRGPRDRGAIMLLPLSRRYRTSNHRSDTFA